MMNPVHVKILRDGAKLPTYGTAGAAGADLYACVDAPVTIQPGETVFIPTGIALEVPRGLRGAGICPQRPCLQAGACTRQ